MTKGLENAKGMDEPVIVCELVPHPEGYWNIDGIPYRPEWPKGFNGDINTREGRLFATTLIETGIAFRNKENPQRIIVNLYASNKIDVFVDGKEQRQYLN